MRSLWMIFLLVQAALGSTCGENEPDPVPVAMCDYADQWAKAKADCDSEKKSQCEAIGLTAVCYTMDAEAPPGCGASCHKCDCGLGSQAPKMDEGL